MDRDFLEEMIEARSKRDPSFRRRVEEATARRESLSIPVQVRFSPSQKALVMRAARRAKVSYTTVIRQLAVAWAYESTHQ